MNNIKQQVAKVVRGLGADQVLLDLDVLPELLHGDTGDGHGVADHHTGGGDDVPWGEGEDSERDDQDHGDHRADQDGHEGDVLPVGDLLRAMAGREAGDRHLHAWRLKMHRSNQINRVLEMKPLYFRDRNRLP